MKYIIIDVKKGYTFTSQDGLFIQNNGKDDLRITVETEPFEDKDYCKKCRVLIKLRK